MATIEAVDTSLVVAAAAQEDAILVVAVAAAAVVITKSVRQFLFKGFSCQFELFGLAEREIAYRQSTRLQSSGAFNLDTFNDSCFRAHLVLPSQEYGLSSPSANL